MAKINSGNRPRIQPAVKSEAKATSGAHSAAEAQKVSDKGAVDRIDVNAHFQSGVPAASSSLTDTLWEGLSGLAESYYGDSTHGAKGGLDLLLKTASGDIDIDAQISPEMRAIKASRLSRETGIPPETSQKIVDLVAHLLAV